MARKGYGRLSDHNIYNLARHNDLLDHCFALQQSTEPFVGTHGGKRRVAVGIGRQSHLAAHLAVDLNRKFDDLIAGLCLIKFRRRLRC